MKKYIVFILLLLIPYIVRAEVKITNVEIVGKTEGLELSNPTFEGLKLNLDINFKQVNNFAKYKVTIKNDTKKDYEIGIDNEFSKGEYFKYEYSFKDENKVIKSNSERVLFLTVTYIKTVPQDNYKNGKFTENNNMVIDLSNDEKNPNTSVGLYVLILIGILILSTVLIILIKKKMNTIPLTLLLLMLIPVSIYALEKITIELSTTITIVGSPKETRLFYCIQEPRNEGTATINYTESMTWADYFASEEGKQAPIEVINLIKSKGVTYYKPEYSTCLEDNSIEYCQNNYMVNYNYNDYIEEIPADKIYHADNCLK